MSYGIRRRRWRHERGVVALQTSDVSYEVTGRRLGLVCADACQVIRDAYCECFRFHSCINNEVYIVDALRLYGSQEYATLWLKRPLHLK